MPGHDGLTGKAYIVGGGIAALASAILLIRDAGWSGEHIHIFEASDVLGGSLDGSGDPHQGYVIRGGRMFEEHYGCTFDLLKDIPTLEHPDVSVTRDIKAFTAATVTSSRCRLVIDGQRQEAPAFGLSFRDKFDLIRLILQREDSLAGATIEDYFQPEFFRTNFWVMWSTMFAFQVWHSLIECRRYMRRFLHLLPGFHHLEGVHRTRFNQYDSIVLPCVSWLLQQGVNVHLRAPVKSIAFNHSHSRVAGFEREREGENIEITVNAEDRMFITLGSMTEASLLGSSTAAPSPHAAPPATGSWSLWRQLAQQSPLFGKPDVFSGATDKTLWESFTVTLRNPLFFQHMETFTGNRAGEGGLVTFKHSEWMLSVVLPHQPHFADQPEDCWVFWGYGLHPWNSGDSVHKPMLECSGEEILQELAHHLGFDAATAEEMFAGGKSIPCRMPYITSQFMPRRPGDRPAVVPEGAENFAFIGQFCEVPEDTVFTVEYSVRTAQQALAGLCKAGEVTRIYRGSRNPKVVTAALFSIASNGR